MVHVEALSIRTMWKQNVLLSTRHKGCFKGFQTDIMHTWACIRYISKYSHSFVRYILLLVAVKVVFIRLVVYRSGWKMGGAGLQACHRRSIFLVQNECDSSPFDHQSIFDEGLSLKKIDLPNFIITLFWTTGAFQIYRGLKLETRGTFDTGVRSVSVEAILENNDYWNCRLPVYHSSLLP